MKKSTLVFSFLLVLLGLWGLFFNFSIVDHVFAENIEYQSMIKKLDVAHKKILSSVVQQEKKADKAYTLLKQTLEKDYSYMWLHCLGILTLDYKSSDGVKTIKETLLRKLLAFNQDIYRYHLGLGWDISTINKNFSQFVSQDIDKESEKIYQEYSTYKTNFLNNLSLYVKNNMDIIMPLISKMKTIQVLKDDLSELQTLTKKTQNILTKDALLWKVAMLKDKFRVILSKRFDMVVKKQGINKTAQEIARIKSQYLSDYDNAFDDLYLAVLSVPYYDLNDEKFNDFVVKYYDKDQYNCSALVGDTGVFAANRRYISAWFTWEKRHLTKFSRAVVGYFTLDVAEQNKRKVVMVQKLKNLMDDYMGVKLTTLFLRM